MNAGTPIRTGPLPLRLPRRDRNPRRPGRPIPGKPHVIVKVVQTCAAAPSQWNAWTANGQYLYLRYRSGIGTADAYDTTDSEQWPHAPDGAAAYFDTGDRLDGEITLQEFCRQAGLILASRRQRAWARIHRTLTVALRPIRPHRAPVRSMADRAH